MGGGASEVCLQGGIHPEYTGQTYIDICRSIQQVVPDMHIHAFSPLEVWQGAKTLESQFRFSGSVKRNRIEHFTWNGRDT